MSPATFCLCRPHTILHELAPNSHIVSTLTPLCLLLCLPKASLRLYLSLSFLEEALQAGREITVVDELLGKAVEERLERRCVLLCQNDCVSLLIRVFVRACVRPCVRARERENNLFVSVSTREHTCACA